MLDGVVKLSTIGTLRAAATNDLCVANDAKRTLNMQLGKRFAAACAGARQAGRHRKSFGLPGDDFAALARRPAPWHDDAVLRPSRTSAKGRRLRARRIRRSISNAIRRDFPITARARQQGVCYLLLRFKRVRNADVVCIERLEDFLRDTQRDGLVVLLAGLRPALRQVLGNLRFTSWDPADRSFPEEDETWSATVRAVRYAYAQLRASNTCPHCAGRLQVEQGPSELDYLV
ncbi:STAS domain-containing protein [Paraburkholderia phenoliruptrix]|uniref:STAS domain-containing protein n=1 Tax=Paraburkholderia phenoliruptrix TaxID=252970 RepID=UPI003207B3AF